MAAIILRRKQWRNWRCSLIRRRACSSNEVQRDSLLGLAVHSRTNSRSSYYLLARPQLLHVGCGLNGECCEWSNVPPHSYLWQWNNWVFLYWLWRPEGAEATQGADFTAFSNSSYSSRRRSYSIVFVSSTWFISTSFKKTKCIKMGSTRQIHITCFQFFFL